MKCRTGIQLVMNEVQNDPGNSDQSRDPEDRPVKNEQESREKMLDKTLADLFPTSDPPSTIQIRQTKILCDRNESQR